MFLLHPPSPEAAGIIVAGKTRIARLAISAILARMARMTTIAIY